MSRLILTLIVFACSFAHGSPVTKCVDRTGKVTFSQYGCAAGAAQESVTVSQPSRPSGDGPAVKMAKPSTQAPKQRAKRTFNHCGDLTQVDIAYAKGRGQITVGMTGDDVRGIWGRPARLIAAPVDSSGFTP